MTASERLGLSMVLVVLMGICDLVVAADYSVDIGWIYYQDGSGREIAYDFSEGSMDDGVVTIPASAVTAPASESGTTFLWEDGFGDQQVSLSGGVYRMAVPQAVDTVPDIPMVAITVDGSPADWSGVATYLTDNTEDWTPTGIDVEYVKLAYSADESSLYILYKLAGTADQNTWYRLFLDNDLDGEADEPGDYQIDVQYNGSSWDVVSQGWNSDDSSDWYAVAENGVVSVSGQYIEARVDTAVFDLPGSVNVYGRTMETTVPYSTYDRFSCHFCEAWGFCSLGACNAAAPAPAAWQFAARLTNFSNSGFGTSSSYLRGYGVGVGVGSSEDDDLETTVEAAWITGHFAGVDYEDALVIMADIENDLTDDDEYEWEWDVGSGGGVVLTGLDAATTVLDLKVEVTNSGQTASFYYRVNSDSADDWELAVAHTLPAGVGTMYGFFDTFPTISMDTWFDCEVPVPIYRFWSPTFLNHFYTISKVEKDFVIATWPDSWTYERIEYYTYPQNTVDGLLPVYRFWSNQYNGHFYTIDANEKDTVIATWPDVWSYEGPAFYAFPEGQQPDGTTPVYRFWSPSLLAHFYAATAAERDFLINNPDWGWDYEGVAWYAYAAQQ